MEEVKILLRNLYVFVLLRSYVSDLNSHYIFRQNSRIRELSGHGKSVASDLRRNCQCS